ncbi:MAG: hypothetical protein APZ16_05790 [Candidatus Hadarchaeum yellowstonense]|uniref:Uncharacterized protein n=1 Tax=Hadarchaeum yellowstonense TaxID=1776334 RepID=A0A147JXD1_HADYE|nr:MAG: hypothetical protein APZ16_05790 [Candidatus Hadarchaeum yellowstonense]
MVGKTKMNLAMLENHKSIGNIFQKLNKKEALRPSPVLKLKSPPRCPVSRRSKICARGKRESLFYPPVLRACR